MIPKIRQFRQWALPTRWSVVASLATVVGAMLAALALWVAVTGPSHERALEKSEERQILIFRAAQELRSNSDLLTQLVAMKGNETVRLGLSPYSVESLRILTSGHFDEVTKNSYGEEKYIYQEVLRLDRWLDAISILDSAESVSKSNLESEFTIYDALFLNDFLWWYLYPIIDEQLTAEQKQGLGWEPYPRSSFRIPADQAGLKQFVLDGQPISDFSDYLGYID